MEDQIIILEDTTQPNIIVSTNHMICPDDQFKTTKKANKKGYVPISSLLEKLNSVLNNNVKYIALKCIFIDDDNFYKIYSDFLVKTREYIEIIDLSHNMFTEKSLNVIKEILYFPNLKFLNITGTLISLRNIHKIVVPLKEDNVPLDIVGKIIFMEKFYISHAKNKVRQYNDLALNKYIPQNWDFCQSNFYQKNDQY